MKYTNLSKKIGKSAFHSFLILIYILFICLYGVLIWVDLCMLQTPVFNLMWLILIPTFGLVSNRIFSRLAGDERYDTGVVVDGTTWFDVVKTPKYYKRRGYCCYLTLSLFVLLIVKTIFTFKLNLLWSIIGVIGGVVGIILSFIFAKSSFELSKEGKTNL